MSKNDDSYWNQFEEVSPEEMSQEANEDYWNQFEEVKPDVSVTESALRGAGQGATLGWSDELIAGGRAIYDDVKSVFTGDNLENAEKVIRDENGRIVNGSELGGEVYEQYLEEERRKNEAAREANPDAYTTGEVGDSIASAFIPGLNIAKGAKLASVAGKSALAGGLSGAGLSEADNLTDLAQDTAVGATIGGATGGAMYGAGKALTSEPAKAIGNKISNLASKPKEMASNALTRGAKKAYQVASDLTDDQMDMILKNPDDIKNALDETGLVEQAMKQVQQLQDNIVQADNNAWSVLSNNKSVLKGATPKQALKSQITNIKAGIKVKGPSQKTALKNLEAFEEAIDDISGNTLSQADLKDFIRALDDNIDWDKQALKSSNEALKTLRNSLDTGLKNANKAYKDAMEPVAQMTNNLDKVKRALALKKEPGVGLVPTDTTISKFKFLPKENKPFSQEVIKDLDKYVGGDLLHQAEISAVNRVTQGGVANGSRNTLQGALAGGATGFKMGGVKGGVAGAVAGGTAGYLKDKMGRKIGKDVLIKGTELLTPDRISKMGKFTQTLSEAAQRGNKALSTTHFLLSQQNPEYREQYKKVQEEEE